MIHAPPRPGAIAVCLALTITAFDDASVIAAPGTTSVSFQQGVGGYNGTVDTFIRQSTPATTLGSQGSVKWDSDEPAGSGLDCFVLIRFDNIVGSGSGQVPLGATVTAATLTFTVFNEGENGAVYEAAVDWNEAVTYNSFGGTPGVQASEFAAFVTTATGGPVGTVAIDATPGVARAALNPTQHKGWIILPIGDDGVEFRSSEYATISQRPKLEVTYTLAPVTPQFVRRPYLQKATSNSIVIAWRTATLTDTRVRYGSTPTDLKNEINSSILTNNHVVTLSGLEPGTTYYYDVGTTSLTMAGGDADHFFMTLPASGARTPLRFWVLGDSGYGTAPQLAVRDAMLAHTAGAPPDFMLHLGDIVYDDGTDAEYTTRFFAPYQNILRHTTCWPTFGNHDGHSAASSWPIGPYYEAFVLPAAGEASGLPSGTEAYYSFDFANVHFICLDSYGSDRSPGSPMLNWLTADLAATNQDWIIAYWHHPPYTKGTHDSDDPGDSDGIMIQMRENVLPILEAGGVDLVLCGHSHGYERSFLVDGAYDTPTTAAGHIVDGGDGQARGDGAYAKSHGHHAHEGAVYVVSGHGGAPIGGDGGHPLMHFSEVANGSCLVTVDGNTLGLDNIRSDGEVTDTFEIIKVIPADLNGDGVVNSLDLGILLSSWSIPPTAPACGGALPCAVDLNDDGFINSLDLGILLANWTL